MTKIDATVFILDDDPLLRDAIEKLFNTVGLKTHTFSSALEFLKIEAPNGPSCLVLDIRMPLLSGLDLQDELIKKGFTIPIIFITGHGTVSMSVRAMKAGAVDFIQKPFEDQELLDAVHKAILMDTKTKKEQAEENEINRRIKSLTPREYEVLILVATGMLNKKIADDLEMSEHTVKKHRAHIMQKMKVESIADLVRLTEKVGIHTHKE